MDNKENTKNIVNAEAFEKIEVFYYKGGVGHFDEVEIFATIKCYMYLIECLTKFVGDLKENKKVELNFDSGIVVEDNNPSLRFFYKKTEYIINEKIFDKIVVNFHKGGVGHFDEVQIFATIEGYKYLIECLTEFVEDLNEYIHAELNLDCGIDVDCGSPSLRFFHK